VANADNTYVDPSALVCLYLHQTGRSRQMASWRVARDGALAVTHHGRTEIVNAICLARFRGDLDEAGLTEALADFEADFAEGRLEQADILWRSALNRAADLSRAHSPTLGTRALDVLHVACALELKLRRFLTFDERQRELAVAAGLKPVKL
jgi:predicted nucleic acid-binding protein